MKKLAVLVFVFLMGFGQNFANDNNNIVIDQNLRNKVADLLKNPEIKLEKVDLTAKIQFTLNKNGEIVVLAVDSQNDFVIDYVKSRLNYKKVYNNFRGINRLYTLKLIIKNPSNI